MTALRALAAFPFLVAASVCREIGRTIAGGNLSPLNQTVVVLERAA